MEDYIVYGIVLIYGILIGSFLNVCIYRIPEELSVVTGRSHCTNCNRKLKWYELVPIISYIFLLGRCRSCKSHISIQYPIIEALNGLMYVLVFYFYGWDSIYALLLSIVYCFVISALIVLSVIDFRTNIIPPGINIFLLVMGLAAVMIKYFESGRGTDVVLDHTIGFFAISLFLLLIYYATKGLAIGGGDIKLMAAAGLLLGWELVIVAFFLGCILAAIIHPLRMRIKNVGRSLAFGPYLSVGTVLALYFGRQMISWYIENFFV
ncbi:MAG: prepilin peptidase [Clostridiales bacterium]|jgi:leader peptidase (prepilin peptidase)/N-methyltransferase|nr:prepilin peptidase [Clostridiales bacterium]